MKVNKIDDLMMKLVHYFVTIENYKPIIVKGIENEIWLENLDKDYKLIRINFKYIHNNYQLKNDTMIAKNVMKTIKKKTFSFRMNLLNFLLNTGEDVKLEQEENIKTVVVKKINDVKKDIEVSESYSKITTLENTKLSPEEFMIMGEEMNNKSKKEETKVAKYFNKIKPTTTYFLIMLNILFFLSMYILGNGSTDTETLIRFGANNVYLVQSGEFYRLFTSMFLHIGIVHLFMNMLVLQMVGPLVEQYYGKRKFIIIYFVSGIVGNLLSCTFTTGISAGASGAIFGLFGSILYFGYNYRATLQGIVFSNMLPLIIINLLLGFVLPGIDVSAHIGGLIGGILISIGLGMDEKQNKRIKINANIFLLIISIFLIFLIFQKI